jgi:hypothetical protein
MLQPGAPVRTRVALVGPHAMTLSDYVSRLRRECGLGEQRVLPLPNRLATASARAVDFASVGFPGRELLAMMRTDLIGDPTAVTEILGRLPRPVEEFVVAPRRSRAPFGLTA